MAEPQSSPAAATDKTKPQPVPPFKHESSLAPFNPTSDQAQQASLKMLNLGANDVLFDLGCGDGRMLLYAAEKTPGLRCVGIELDPVFVGRGREALKALPASVQTRVDIRRGDLLKLMKEIQPRAKDDGYAEGKHSNEDKDAEEEEYKHSILGKECRDLTFLRDATSMYMFLLPKGIRRVQQLLNALVERRKEERRPFHAVAYMFSIREWEPAAVDKTTKGDAPIYLYRFLPEYGEKENLV